MEFNLEDLDVEHLLLETTGEALGHLTKEELVSLIKKYKNGGNVNDLLNEFNISVPSSMLVRNFPKIKYLKCSNCLAEICCPIASKSSQDLLNIAKQECWNCSHKPNFKGCNCTSCLENRRKAEKNEDLRRTNILLEKKGFVAQTYL